MIILFYGEDTFSIQNEVAKISSAKNSEIFRSNSEINLFINNLLSSSFFSNKRIFICENYLETLNEAERTKLIGALDKIPTETSVVFTERNEPRGEFKKFLTKKGQIKKLEKPAEKDVINYINQLVIKEGGQISPLAAERLASFVGPDYWQLTEEVKKLTLYKKSDNQDELNKNDIQTADVDYLVKSNFEANIFELIDAISTRNQRRAARLISQFLDSGENDIYIFSMIARQFRNIAMVKFDEIKNETKFAKVTGVHPYVAKKSIAQARNFNKKEILNIYKKLTKADLALKSGFQPKQVLLSLIF